MPAHTVSEYCSFGGDESEGDAEGGAEASREDSAEKGAIVRSLIGELSKNSLDSMAKEIFSLYLCVRWAPSPDFVKTAQGEINAGQLSNKSTSFEHFKSFRFMPLRCSKSVNVYGNSPKLGHTHFDDFEAEMKSLAEWYDTEKSGAVAARLAKMTYDMKHARGTETLEAEAEVFDLDMVEKATRACEGNTKPILADTFNSPSHELLKDCGAVKWWQGKLKDWLSAMPFTSFMSPDDEAAKQAAPENTEQVLMCFGKRVASKLHRREQGSHLLTDQSAVGCHGFWDLETAAKMLRRIVDLWKPPTCQLAAMELSMKIRIMEVIASMNSNLFDALPAMLVEEMTENGEWDGKELQASSGLGIMRGVFNSIVSAFKSARGKYVRLGQLLGSTVVKWVVCPLRPITDEKKLQLLDGALGTEDDLARYYAETAYSKWTGKTDLLPGEACDGAAPGMPRTRKCSLGRMRENMPEPYHDEEFICPIRPLLPASQQVEIFKKKHGLCVMHMNSLQMREAQWYYRGRTPQKKQYNKTENIPKDSFQYVKVLGIKSKPDTDFGIWRDFVTLGRRCTEAEAAATPRWCEAPLVHNAPSVTRDLLSGLEMVGHAAGSAASAAAVASGAVEPSVANHAVQERLGQWFDSRFKGLEAFLRRSYSRWLGKATGRYQRLRERLFSESEAAEFVHSLSFQEEIRKDGADSKGYQKYDRYAVTCPCESFDPEREFGLRYKWSENALDLAGNARDKFEGLLDSTAFRVQLRGDGVLSMRNEETAWMTYFTHVAAAGVGRELPQPVASRNPFLLQLSGALSTHSDAGVRASDLLGFEATFACGTRLEMHGLPLPSKDVPATDALEHSGPKRSFLDCLKTGALENQRLRAESPAEDFLPGEYVVRVTFSEIPTCFHETMTDNIRFANETENPVFKNFLWVTGCKALSAVPEGKMPEDLQAAKRAYTYRGMLLGKGLPMDTLAEVIMDPADFVDELEL
uniref:Uncharacterized protein n=1 Tax=Pyrodinium bahamense TaxID=73915 RepID=A0A7S0A396_9DINO